MPDLVELIVVSDNCARPGESAVQLDSNCVGAAAALQQQQLALQTGHVTSQPRYLGRTLRDTDFNKLWPRGCFQETRNCSPPIGCCASRDNDLVF